MTPAADGPLADPPPLLLVCPDTGTRPDAERRWRRQAWLASVSFHALLLSLAAAPAWWHWFDAADGAAGQQVTLDARVVEQESLAPLAEANLLLADDWAATSAAQLLLEELPMNDWPQWRAAVEAEAVLASSPPAPEPRIDPLAAFGQRLEALIVSGAAAGSRLSEEERRARLAQLAGELEELSSPAAVEEVAASVQRLLGTAERAERPAERLVSGAFDFDTAQLHEVRRVRGPDGQWEYLSVLVDAAGRKFETPLDPAEGESAYRTMELLKSNPLAELIYRRVAMSLLDKLIDAGRQAATSESPASAVPPGRPAAEPASPADP